MVEVLKNGRFAFTSPCPWEGKNGKQLVAFKFCSGKDHAEYVTRMESEHFEEQALEERALSEPPEFR